MLQGPQLDALHQVGQTPPCGGPSLHQPPDELVAADPFGIVRGQPADVGLQQVDTARGLDDFLLKLADAQFVTFHGAPSQGISRR